MLPASFVDCFNSELPYFYHLIERLQLNAKVRPDALTLSSERRKALLGTHFWAPLITQLHDLRTELPSRSATVVSEERIVPISPVLSTGYASRVSDLIETLHPWRKGPFSVGETTIDSEWQSWMKWDRIKNHIPDLTNKIAADVGCNNGYYLYRLLEKNPLALLGLDPNDRFMLQFFLLRLLSGHSNICYEPLGVDDLNLFPEIFDLILCLGVIYHRQNPLAMLQTVRMSLRKGGTAVIESLTIPEEYAGSDSCLFVRERYAQMRNVYFIPTSQVFADWMRKAGFSNVEIIDETITTTEEQRKTSHARFASLEDFLDPNDTSKTVEGYPAPRRTIVKGTRD